MELTTLSAYILEAQHQYDLDQEEREFRYHSRSSIPFEDESLIYAIQDWYSMRGEFTKEEYAYLEKTWNFTKYDVDFLVEHDPATGLSLDDEEEEE